MTYAGTSLADAAIGGFPSRHARFVDASVAPDAHWALAVIVLNPDDLPYPMLVWMECSSIGWNGLVAEQLVEGGSRLYGEGEAARVVWAAGRAPAGARRARLRVAEKTADRQIVSGWYVVAVWDLGLGDDATGRLELE